MIARMTTHVAEQYLHPIELPVLTIAIYGRRHSTPSATLARHHEGYAGTARREFSRLVCMSSFH